MGRVHADMDGDLSTSGIFRNPIVFPGIFRKVITKVPAVLKIFP